VTEGKQDICLIAKQKLLNYATDVMRSTGKMALTNQADLCYNEEIYDNEKLILRLYER